MTPPQIKAVIIGARAFTAGELLRVALRHPNLRIAGLMARGEGGEDIGGVFGFLRGRDFPRVEPIDFDRLPPGTEAAFLTLPHTIGAEYAPRLLDRGLRVFDLSADFRFRDHRVYEKVYDVTHPAPDLNRTAIYGLPEIARANLIGARLVAVPGCYPTAVTLALAPLMKHEIIRPGSIIADCKSGVSGAGRNPTDTTHFVNVNEAFCAYKVAEHRHQPEIEETLSRLAGAPRGVTFVPHLVPMDRGILATCYAQLTEEIREEAVRGIFESFYRDEPFVRLLPPGVMPNTKNVTGSNICELNVRVDAKNQRLIVLSAIDNLVKGASGQAIQCFNVSFGLDETAGLL
jgi:N-acetyl-gamma-glutamyl-phosphate reductase